MSTSVTSTQLAKGLSDILNRIYYQGESFVVERNGQAVASLAPIQAAPTQGVVWRDVVAAFDDLTWPDAAFADDLAAIQATQPPLEQSQWDS